jgi:hypothetical protein
MNREKTHDVRASSDHERVYSDQKNVKYVMQLTGGKKNDRRSHLLYSCQQIKFVDEEGEMMVRITFLIAN